MSAFDTAELRVEKGTALFDNVQIAFTVEFDLDPAKPATFIRAEEVP